MDWAWAIPIIAFIVWIIAQVIRAGQQANVPPPPQRPPQPRPQRAADAEIERFLEEINRRRQAQRERPAEAPPPRREVPTVQPVEAPAPKPRPRPVPRAKPVSQPPPVRRPPAPSLVEPLPTPAAPPPIPVPPVPDLVQAAQAEAAAVAEEIGRLEFKPIAPVKRPEPPPLLKRLREMLTSDGIRTAILVNELIGPPKCLRRSIR